MSTAVADAVPVKSIPPMPPPGSIPPPPAFFFGTSATMATVVIRSAATEAAFWIATRVDDAFGDQVDVFASLAIKAIGVLISRGSCRR